MKRRSNGKNKGLRKSEQRDLERKIADLMGKNYFDEEIMLELGIQPHVLRHYKQRIAENVVFEFTKGGSQGVFERYARHGLKTIRELEEIVRETSDTTRSLTAAIQAVRLQNNIVRSTIRLARELGLITKRTRSVTVGGFIFQNPTKHPLNLT